MEFFRVKDFYFISALITHKDNLIACATFESTIHDFQAAPLIVPALSSDILNHT